MPRAACRLKLEIVETKPQRVLDITDEQALREGVTCTEHYLGKKETTPRTAFLSLWDEINAKRGYAAESNPWAWAVTFRIKEEAS